MKTAKTRELFGWQSEYNYGCEGGWMHTHWKFQKKYGAMTYKSYPYKAREGKCAHDSNNIYGHVASYKSWHGRNDLEAMMQEAYEKPVSVVLYAGGKNFRFYKNGILKSCCDRDEDPTCDDMDNQINHAVTVWGYKVQKKERQPYGHWRIQNSWGKGWGMNGLMKLDLFGKNDGVCNINRFGVWSVDFDLDSMKL